MASNSEVKRHTAFTLLRTLRHRILYLLVPMVLLTAGAVYYSRRLPVRYRARVLVASEAAPSAPYLTDRSAAAVNVQEQLRAIRERLLSRPVLEAVIREFQLYDLSGSGAVDRAVDEIKPRIQILVDSPDAFYIGFEGQQPQRVMEVANRLATLFVERTSYIQGQQVAQVDGLLDSEVDRLRRQLSQQEDALRVYKESVAQVLPDRLTANLKLLEDVEQQAHSKSDQIAEAQARQLAIQDELKALEGQGALEAQPRQKTPNEVALEDLRRKLRQLKTRYTAQNPEIQRTEEEIRQLEAAPAQPGPRSEPSALHLRYVALQAELASLDQRLKSYQQERAALTSQITAYENRIDSSPGPETTLARRMKDVDLTRTQYESMLAKQQAAKLNQRVETSSRHAAFRITEPAELPTVPYTPQTRQIVLLAFLASLGLGFGAIVFVEHLDTTFGTIEDLQAFTNIPVLSGVPSIGNAGPMPGAERNGHKNGHGGLSPRELAAVKPDEIAPEQRRHMHKCHITVVSDPQSIASQQYGILMLKIDRWREQTGGRVLVVTSAAGGEGKSLTAVNLSMALASSMDGRVLLVDCDLRRPQVAQRLGIQNSMGFSDLLSGSCPEPEACITKVGKVYVMPGGTHSSSPDGLLSTWRTRQVLDRLKKEYELIILDSPPIVPIADSHFLASLADGVIVVVRARETRRELLQRAVESLGTTNILGVVLNDVEHGDTRYAYAYRYYQRNYMSRR